VILLNGEAEPILADRLAKLKDIFGLMSDSAFPSFP
jgi:hypothetical protein